jgi:hypothetical protein
LAELAMRHVGNHATRRRDQKSMSDVTTHFPIHILTLVDNHISMAASDTEARKELVSHFGSAVSEHPDVMSECK